MTFGFVIHLVWPGPSLWALDWDYALELSGPTSGYTVKANNNPLSWIYQSEMVHHQWAGLPGSCHQLYLAIVGPILLYTECSHPGYLVFMVTVVVSGTEMLRNFLFLHSLCCLFCNVPWDLEELVWNDFSRAKHSVNHHLFSILCITVCLCIHHSSGQEKASLIKVKTDNYLYQAQISSFGLGLKSRVVLTTHIAVVYKRINLAGQISIVVLRIHGCI